MVIVAPHLLPMPAGRSWTTCESKRKGITRFKYAAHESAMWTDIVVRWEDRKPNSTFTGRTVDPHLDLAFKKKKNQSFRAI